jgi:hypothetical protein
MLPFETCCGQFRRKEAWKPMMLQLSVPIFDHPSEITVVFSDCISLIVWPIFEEFKILYKLLNNRT